MTTTIDKALSSLEARAAEVLRCDWCLVVVTSPSLSYSTKGLNPAEITAVTCRWCGWRVVYSVGGLDVHEIESLRLYMDAGPGDRFRDPRAYAAEQWYPLRGSARKCIAAYRRFKEGLPPVTRRAAPPRNASAPRPDKVQRKADEAKRERELRLERGRAFVRLIRAKEKKEYGPYSFPLAAEVKTILAEKVETIIAGVGRISWGEQVAREAMKCLRAMELCEGALWGEVLAETREALAEMLAAVEAFTAERERAAVEKLRQEEEQREAQERARREREGLMSAPVGKPVWQAQDAPISRFRKEGATASPEAARMVYVPDPADPNRQMIVGHSIGPEDYDPNDPDAVGFMRSSPPKPPERRYYRGPDYDGDPRY